MPEPTSAVRYLTRALGCGHVAERVKVSRGDAPPPRPLSEREYTVLLAQPDGRTRVGRRDLAALYLLGSCGLRRGELRELRLEDLEKRERADPELGRAVAGRRGDETRYWLTVRHSKHG